MYDVNYENLTFSDAYQLMSSNRSVSQVKCQDGWDYDTSQYRTSISMDVSRINTFPVEYILEYISRNI